MGDMIGLAAQMNYVAGYVPSSSDDEDEEDLRPAGAAFHPPRPAGCDREWYSAVPHMECPPTAPPSAPPAVMPHHPNAPSGHDAPPRHSHGG
eukprot:3152621-Pyramimonas_sp.AAC.2